MDKTQQNTPQPGPPEPETRQERCPQHGDFIATHYPSDRWNVRDFWTECPECREEQRQKRVMEDWSRGIQERLRSLVEEIGVPTRFAGKTLDTFQVETDEQRRALTVAREYAENFTDHRKAGRCLVFCGAVGTGKTHAAMGIARAVVEASPVPPVGSSYSEVRWFGRHVTYWTVQEVIRTIRDTWCRESRITEREVLDKLTALDLLILDEVGVQFGSEAERNQLFEVINNRYNAQRPTLIVSNLDIKGITTFLGERAVDRLRENGGKVFTFRGKSWRGKRVGPEEQISGSSSVQ